jgi:hypothetical protein
MFPSMETTLTIRLPRSQRAALKRRAKAEGSSESELVRAMIEREIGGGFHFDRVRHLIGSVQIDRKRLRADVWAEHIRRMNWRE